MRIEHITHASTAKERSIAKLNEHFINLGRRYYLIEGHKWVTKRDGSVYPTNDFDSHSGGTKYFNISFSRCGNEAKRGVQFRKVER